jgi:D-alanyl-D-alanine carboxypeptidase
MPPLQNPSTPTTDETSVVQPSEAPPSEAGTQPHVSTRQRLLGLAFLVVSIIGGFGVFVALVPSVAYQEPKTQLAAAAARRAEPFKDIEILAEAAYVYDVRRDSELFAKNSSTQLPLASLTKVMLALVVAEVLPLEERITISREAVERGGGGLTWGEEWHVRDLIDYTLITSSNTGAEALSEAAMPLLALKYPNAANTHATVSRMNALARDLGLRETYFVNVTGLDESETQAGAQGSARDIATLFAYALRTNPDLFTGTTHTDVALGPTNFPERSAHNTNNALAEIDGLLMGKTGTTDLAGGNLAVAFLAGAERPIIIVVLGSTPEGRFADITALAAAARTAVGAE